MSTAKLTVQDQLTQYAAVAWQPEDLIEVRYIPADRQTGTAGSFWTKAKDLPTKHERAMEALNHRPAGISAGILPRKAKGGKSDADCLPGSVIWADFDGVTPRAALERATGAGMPKPSMVVSSGHGTHLYWRLTELTDPEKISALVADVAALLGSDPAVSNPSRVLRLPGFINWKPPVVKAVLLYADPSARYDFAALRAVVPVPKRQEAPPRISDAPEKSAPKPKPVAAQRLPAAADDAAPAPTASPHARCLNAMRRAHIVDKSDGSHRLFAMACRCVEHDLQDADAIACIREYAIDRPFPREYSDAEIVDRLRDAEKRCQRGVALAAEADGCVKLGNRDPGTGRLVLSPRRTLPTAEAYMREFHMHPDGLTLRCYAGLLMGWLQNHYVEVEDAAMRNRLQPWLHGALRYMFDKRAGGLVLVAFESNPATVNAAFETIRNHVHLPATVTPPAWLENADVRPDPREILSCKTINLHIPTDEALPATPALFTTTALDFDFDPRAPAPVLWLRFLDQLWGNDAESIALLQEWFGYSLTPDTSQQKMLLLVGPKRSGKGTIGRVQTSLIGKANVTGPTMASLAGTFGLHPLIGKSLAIVSDARFGGENIHAVIERLLCISGEDTLTVDRKYLPSVTLRLPTRFMFLTNELPKLCDASGALAGRFLMLRLTKSFYDCEDHGLTDKLLKELPGVLLWSLQGWLRLRQRGRFVQPKTVGAIIRDLEDLSSPVGAFVRQRCVVGPGKSVEMGRLYDAWKSFCNKIGREHPGTTQSFGRDLHAVLPQLGTRQARVGDGRDRFYEGIGLAD